MLQGLPGWDLIDLIIVSIPLLLLSLLYIIIVIIIHMSIFRFVSG